MIKVKKCNSVQCYCVLLVVLYLCSRIISVFEVDMPRTVLIVYRVSRYLIRLLIMLIVLKQPSRIPFDYLIISLLISVYYILTILLYPEYKFYISNEFWNNVLSLNGGIFGYFIMRFVRQEDLIEKGVKIASVIWFSVLLVQSLAPISQGYWYIMYKEDVIKSSYNMTFGYNMLIPSLVFLYYGMSERKIIYTLAALIGALEIVMLGSRGAILGILVMPLLYIFLGEHHMKKNRKIALISFMIIWGIIVVLYYKQIIMFLDYAFDSMGFSSRTLQRILEGSITEDVARANMYSKARELIKNNTWGYGMLADRYYFGVYCHNIFYEVLLQFGWFLGTILIIWFSVITIKVLFGKDNKIKNLFFIFFSASFFRLLVSHSFWINQFFWCAIGLAVNYIQLKKLKCYGCRRI